MTRGNYLGSVDIRTPDLGRLGSYRILSDFLKSLDYQRLPGMMRRKSMEDSSVKRYEVQRDRLSSNGTHSHLFSTIPPLTDADIEQAKRQRIELYRVEKM